MSGILRKAAKRVVYGTYDVWCVSCHEWIARGNGHDLIGIIEAKGGSVIDESDFCAKCTARGVLLAEVVEHPGWNRGRRG